MEKIRWADLSDSSSDELIPQVALNLDSFKQRFKHLSLPISLFIKNISFKCTSDQEISQWFSQQVSTPVQVIRNFKKIMFKGDAKVTVYSFDTACKIFNLSGADFMGRPLQIKVLESILPRHRKQNSWSSFSGPKDSSFNVLQEKLHSNVSKPVRVFKLLQKKPEIKKRTEELVKVNKDAQGGTACEKPKAEVFNQRKSRRTNSYFSLKDLNV